MTDLFPYFLTYFLSVYEANIMLTIEKRIAYKVLYSYNKNTSKITPSGSYTTFNLQKVIRCNRNRQQQNQQRQYREQIPTAGTCDLFWNRNNPDGVVGAS